MKDQIFYRVILVLNIIDTTSTLPSSKFNHVINDNVLSQKKDRLTEQSMMTCQIVIYQSLN
jgi:hypothetical protein